MQGDIGRRRLLCPSCVAQKKRDYEAQRTATLRVEHHIRAIKIWVHHEPYERLKRIAIDRGVSVSVLFQDMIATRVAEEGRDTPW